jgi:Fe2+ transport system protein FeoA
LRIILSRADRFLNPTVMKSGPSSLEDLAVGGSARVLDVAGEDAVAIRLLEMGLTPGVAVSVLGRAPFGDPIELELRGYRLSIRRAEAGRVTVETA